MKTLYHPSCEEIQLTAVLYALSDPTRLKIVRDLNQQGQCCCSSIEATVCKSTMSHHFRVLREAGVIYVQAEGTLRKIAIRREELAKRFPGLLDSVLQAVKEME